MKPAEAFGKNAKVKSGLRSRCKKCEAASALERYHANRDAECARMRARYEENKEYYRARALKWHYDNHEASTAKARQWKAANKERVAEYNATHYAQHKGHHNRRYREWARQNRDARRDYMREWLADNPDKSAAYARKRLRDPRVRLENAVRCRIWGAIARGSKAGRSSFDLLGYSADELKVHLERQFQRGMTWANFGSWHIDHILPLSSFNYTTPDDPDFKLAWALTNLRPLWAKENLEKGAKRLNLI